MSGPKIPIGRIKNNWLRRVAMCIVFPAMIVWAFNWRLIAMPIMIAWNAIEAAVIAARDSVAFDCSARGVRLLIAGWKMMWAAPIGEGNDRPT